MPRQGFLFNAESRFAIDYVTFAATITPDAYSSGVKDVFLTGNTTLNAPTNPQDGQELTFRFYQDSVGSRTLSLGSGIHTPSAITLTLTTTALAMDVVKMRYSAFLALWVIESFVKY